MAEIQNRTEKVIISYRGPSYRIPKGLIVEHWLPGGGGVTGYMGTGGPKEIFFVRPSPTPRFGKGPGERRVAGPLLSLTVFPRREPHLPGVIHNPGKAEQEKGAGFDGAALDPSRLPRWGRGLLAGMHSVDREPERGVFGGAQMGQGKKRWRSIGLKNKKW